MEVVGTFSKGSHFLKIGDTYQNSGGDFQYICEAFHDHNHTFYWLYFYFSLSSFFSWYATFDRSNFLIMEHFYFSLPIDHPSQLSRWRFIFSTGHFFALLNFCSLFININPSLYKNQPQPLNSYQRSTHSKTSRSRKSSLLNQNHYTPFINQGKRSTSKPKSNSITKILK